MIQQRLRSHLEQVGFINKSQSGFRKAKSADFRKAKSADDHLFPGNLNRCAQRRMGQCYFQRQTLLYLWASAKRIYGFELIDFL